MARCVNNQNKPDAARQVPHTVNTLWALSQLWVRAGAERPFVFFVLSWAVEGGAAAGGGGVSGMTAPHEKRFTQAEKAHKRRCMTSYGGEDWHRDYIFSYRRGWKDHNDGLWNSSLCGFLPRIIYNLHLVRLQESMQSKAAICSRTIKQHFPRNDIVLSDGLSEY